MMGVRRQLGVGSLLWPTAPGEVEGSWRRVLPAPPVHCGGPRREAKVLGLSLGEGSCPASQLGKRTSGSGPGGVHTIRGHSWGSRQELKGWEQVTLGSRPQEGRGGPRAREAGQEHMCLHLVPCGGGSSVADVTVPPAPRYPPQHLPYSLTEASSGIMLQERRDSGLKSGFLLGQRRPMALPSLCWAGRESHFPLQPSWGGGGRRAAGR